MRRVFVGLVATSLFVIVILTAQQPHKVDIAGFAPAKRGNVKIQDDKRHRDGEGKQEVDSPEEKRDKSEKKQKRGGVKLKYSLVGFVSSGCSGSTAVWKTTKALLEAHGVAVMEGVSEGMKASKNKFWSKDMDAYHNIMRQHAAAKKNNEVWFTKLDGDPKGSLADKGKARALREIDPPIFISYRKDHVAKTICSIRDCFGDWGGKGYPVHPNNGTRWDLCFQRRKLKDGDNSKVYLDVDFAVSQIQGSAKLTERHLEKVQELVSQALNKDVPVIASDDLLGFGLDAAELPKSVKSSRRVLRALGVVPDDDKILQVLKPKAGKRSAESNRDKIYNYDAIVKALGRDF